MGDYLGLRLRPFELGQASELDSFLRRYPQRLSGYTVGMLAAWDPVFHYQWCRPEPEALIVACTVDPEPDRHLIQPVGVPSAALLARIAEAAQRLPYALKVYGASQAFLDAHPAFAARFEVREELIADNYLYAAEDLALLAGRKFSAKRNHLAQAAREYTWQAQPLVQADAAECVALARRLFEESTRSQSMERDVRACEIALEHLDALRLRGTAIRVEGRIEAFAIWEALDAETAVVHFERAARTHKGLYQVVNREAAKVMLAEGFRWINREEDLGDEGLRKAKLSYHPIRLEKAFTLTCRR